MALSASHVRADAIYPLTPASSSFHRVPGRSSHFWPLSLRVVSAHRSSIQDCDLHLARHGLWTALPECAEIEQTRRYLCARWYEMARPIAHIGRRPLAEKLILGAADWECGRRRLCRGHRRRSPRLVSAHIRSFQRTRMAARLVSLRTRTTA